MRRIEAYRLRVAHAPTVAELEPRTAGGRVIEATLRCLARWGLAKTTLEDVAREAGVGRATLYRLFPGGRDALIAAVVGAEVQRLFDGVAVVVTGAADLEDALVGAVVVATAALRGHDALRVVCRDEPEVLLPHVAFGRFDRLLAVVGEVAGPLLDPWMVGTPGPERTGEAARLAEWVARLVLSYALDPTDDLADPDTARRVIGRFVMPAVASWPPPPLSLIHI